MKFDLHVTLLLIISNCVASQDNAGEDDDASLVELQLADFDLIDAYDEISESYKNYLVNTTELDVKIQLEKDLGELLRIQSKTNHDLVDVPYEHQRKWNLLTKTGNYLMPKTEFDSLVDFYNENLNISHQAQVLNKQEYEDALAIKRNKTVLDNLWTSWQNIFSTKEDQFPIVLETLNEAYVPNEADSVKDFWEMLSEYDDGYNEALQLWKDVQPLYKKLHEFVKVRLENYYNTALGDEIPVYLLGTNFGDDWINIADIVLPRPQSYFGINTKLKNKTAKDIYKLTEEMTKHIGLGNFGKKFWKKSNFNFSSCGPHLISNCGKKYTQVFTCSKMNLKSFLDIHESGINVALRNRDYTAVPRGEMRYSAVDEALRGLGSLIAFHKLPTYKFVSEASWSEETALLLTALRVLPKLPYYLLSDIWRLEELQSPRENFTDTWWGKRIYFQGVRAHSNTEADFLGDDFISANKPKLSKFLGVFLQFQFFDYYSKYYSTESGTVADFIKQDDNFVRFIEDRPNKDWVALLNFYFNIDKVTSEALLEYFKPLDNYLDEASAQLVVLITNEPSTSTASSTQSTTSDIETSSPSNTSTERSPSSSTKYSGSHEKVWILLGVGGVVLIGVVILFFILQLRRKRRKHNNRRFET
ncbi:hypothetical protein FQA39_LY01565 [Lamprigera yunnana]|nr:hypothetical protein FQA39_LY01565 [Lamprigera yunnana]